MLKVLVFSFGVLSLLFMPSHAQDSGGFAGEHLLNKLKIQECRLAFALGSAKVASGEIAALDAYKSYLKCKSEANNQIAETHKRMSGKFKSATQKAAVKDYRVAIGLALEGSEPRDNELKSNFEARLARLDEDVERAWQRLTVE